MTESLTRLADHEPDRAWRALAVGVAATGTLLAAALLSGLLPPGMPAWVALGAGLACLCGLLATLAHRLLLRRSMGDARLQAMRVQATLGLGFLAKLFGLLAGTGALVAAGVKFAGIAAFAVAFAAASLVFQVCTALSMARTLPGRAPVDRPTS